MRIRQAELMASAYGAKDFPGDRLPEVAFLGRSNVGKSSLINRLLERKNLARTSSTPGKTRALYFYLVDEMFYFVDLPGYGYAKVSKTTQQTWGPLIEEYLGNRDNLRGCFQLVDCRHNPTEDDLLMARWLRFHQIYTVTVATKSDKLSRGALINQMSTIREQLVLTGSEPLFAFSARTGSGRDLLWRALSGMVDSRGKNSRDEK